MPAVGSHNHIMGLLAKEQADIDTAETLSATTDGCDIYIGDGDPPPPEETQEVFNGKTTSGRGAGSLAPRLAMAPLGFFRQGQYQQRMRGSLVAYSASVFPPNELHRWFKACGLDATFSATPTPQWLYTPTPPNTPGTILTTADFRQQDRYDLRNVVGTFTMESTPGGAVVVTFEYRGIQDAVPTNTAMPAITIAYHAVIPPAAAGITASLGGVTTVGVRKFTFRQQLTLDTVRALLNGTGLHAGWVRGGMGPELELEIERPQRSLYNPEQLRRAGTSHGVSLQVGGTQYNRFTLSLPQAQIGAPVQPTADGSITTAGLRYHAHASTPGANDFFSLLMN